MKFRYSNIKERLENNSKKNIVQGMNVSVWNNSSFYLGNDEKQNDEFDKDILTFTILHFKTSVRTSQ